MNSDDNSSGEDWYESLRREYRNDLVEIRQRMRALKTELDEVEVQRVSEAFLEECHQLAGSAGSYGFDALSRIAVEIEDELSEKRRISSDELETRIERLCEAIQEALE